MRSRAAAFALIFGLCTARATAAFLPDALNPPPPFPLVVSQ
jgi:hypothetical protein